MKIVAYLETEITSGGAFHQGLNAIQQMQKISADNFEFAVMTTHAENVHALEKLGIKAIVIKKTLLDKIFHVLINSSFCKRQLFRTSFISPFEKQFSANDADLVYFLSPSTWSSVLVKLPFITTVFDLCHRDFPEFPEVRECGVFQDREEFYRANLPLAVLVLVDSLDLADKLIAIYGLDKNRVIAMPFGIADVNTAAKPNDIEQVIAHYGILPNYFFYPAQLWPHKNHVRIIEAISLLKQKKSEFNVVFAGSDKGNQQHLKKIAQQVGVVKQIAFIGFVPQEHMSALYSASLAVIMPTYFGPTNLPPLEAWTFKKPLIYSSHLKNHAQDAALLVDPDNANDIADAMMQCTNKETVEPLIAKGELRLTEITKERCLAEEKLSIFLTRFKLRRSCWTEN